MNRSSMKTHLLYHPSFSSSQFSATNSKSPEIYGLLLEKIDGDQEGIPSARRLGFMKLKGVPESEIKESFVIRLV